MKDYVVYTDGAYSSARNCGGVGIIILKDDQVILEYNRAYPNTTNNRMEIEAVITALKCIQKEVNSFTIYTDSMYVIGCAVEGWQRKKNQDLWNKFDKIYEKANKLCPNIIFKHVKGHDGNEYNERVDKLAVNAYLNYYE